MCDVGLGDHATVFWANLIGDHPQNMTLDLLNEILRQAKAFGPRPRIGLAFTEPLIHPWILEFCRAIVGQGFYCQITSNGTTLERLAESLVEIGVDEITISVDGPWQCTTALRQTGTFENFTQASNALMLPKSANRVTKIAFSFTITDVNYDHILEFVQTVEPLKPASMYLAS
jgi:MoaA/NifB/PqqE/SkfB family radical SAM enzyme